MASAYGFEVVDSCLTCPLRTQSFFCALPAHALEAFEKIKIAFLHSAGSTLFAEDEMPRGIYILCRGRVKLSINSSEGKTFIVRLAPPGDVLGLDACVSGRRYGLTAETMLPSQVVFVKRDDFLRFLKEHGDALCERPPILVSPATTPMKLSA
jgi:CRP/FNR family transcriptional regulator